MARTEKDIADVERYLAPNELKRRAGQMTDLETVAWSALILGNELEYKYIKNANNILDPYAKKYDAGKKVPEPYPPEGYVKGVIKLQRRVGIAKEMYGGASLFTGNNAEIEPDEDDEEDEDSYWLQ